MSVLRHFSLVFLTVAIGCVTNDRRLTELLVDPECNIIRQRAYITETQVHLANSVGACEPRFFDPPVSTGFTDRPFFVSHATQGWIRIASDGWFHFVSHSSTHASLKKIYYPDVGELSIGMDNSGQYFFCRTHACGAPFFTIPPSGGFKDMAELQRWNPFWHPIPNDWQSLAPHSPPIDIASYVVGKWNVELTDVSSGRSFRGYVDFQPTGHGRGVVSLVGSNVVYGGRTPLECSVASFDSVLFTSSSSTGFTGPVYLKGLDFEGVLKEPVEDTDRMNRLRLERQTNSVEVILSHTNHYNVRLRRVATSSTPAD